MRRKLTAIQVKNSKLDEGKNQRKLADGGGLFLLLKKRKSGSVGKYWRYSFSLGGKSSTFGLGQYPHVSLAKAREAHEEAHRFVKQGRSPASAYKSAKLGATFSGVANEFYELMADGWSETHAYGCRRLLDNYILPHLGSMPIDNIEPPDALEMLKKMETKGIISSMHKAKILTGQVFRYGVAKGVCKRDQTADLKGALKREKTVSFPALTEESDIKDLMMSVNDYAGHFSTRKGLVLLAHTFVRSGELRGAKREEFDFDKKIWTIPKTRMKNKKTHFVPLSKTVIETLETLFEIGKSDYILPSSYSSVRIMSENTLNVAIKRMGFSGRMTSHGFRAMASTRLNEMGYNPDAIESQLSHSDGNSVRAAYNRGTYWEERVKMMNAWSEYLLSL